MPTSLPTSKFVVVRDQSEASIDAGPILLLAAWAVAMLLIGGLASLGEPTGSMDSFQILGALQEPFTSNSGRLSSPVSLTFDGVC